MADYTYAAEQALARMLAAHEWLQSAMDEREKASNDRAMAAYEAHEAGVSYFDIGRKLGVSKTTALRIVKDGELEKERARG